MEESYIGKWLVNPFLTLTRNKTTEGSGHVDQTADLSHHRPTQTNDGNRIGQRVRDAINGYNKSKDPGTTTQYNNQNGHNRERQTKVGSRPYNPKLSTSNNYNGPTNHSHSKYDGHGNRPCHNRHQKRGPRTEIDKEEKEPIRRSKRLTKTNPIIRYNNPICHDYRKHRKQTEFGNTGSTNSTTGGERRRSLDRSDTHIQTLRPIANRNKQSCQERSTVHQKLDQWRNTRHNKHSSNPIGRSSANSKGGECRGQTNSNTN